MEAERVTCSTCGILFIVKPIDDEFDENITIYDPENCPRCKSKIRTIGKYGTTDNIIAFTHDS